MLPVIRINSNGDAVTAWQYFLIGQGLYQGEADGDFGEKTLEASKAFQLKHGIQPDGIIGNKSYGVAMQLGFTGTIDIDENKASINWPKKPNFSPLTSNEERANIFGRYSYIHKPVPGNKENIKITDDWEEKNIITVKIPQLIPIKGSDKVRFHKLAAPQLTTLWSEWESAGLIHLVLTWEGSFVPRFIRGSKIILSNHAFGSAFDINYNWNQLGAIPAIVGQKGSVRELVSIANKNGFYWGGHFSRLDGMHFEIAKIL